MAKTPTKAETPEQRKHRYYLANQLALALCGGSWEHQPAVERLDHVLGTHWAFVPKVVDRVLNTWLSHPSEDQFDELVAMIATHGSLRYYLREARPRPAVKQLPLWPLHFPARRAEWAAVELPLLEDRKSLAQHLGLFLFELDWFADERGLSRQPQDERLRHYEHRWIPRRNGIARLLEAPKPRLKWLQRKILRTILDRLPAHVGAHGFVANRSVRSFAEPHCQKSVVIALDLRAFFASTCRQQLIETLHSAGYPVAVSRAIAALCTTRTPTDVIQKRPRPAGGFTLALMARTRIEDDVLRQHHLPAGAPTSPALSNLAAFGLDTRLSGLARAWNAQYTRYADDLAFSGGVELRRRSARFIEQVRAIIKDEGYSPNDEKTRFMPASQQQKLAGIVVNERPTIARAEVERLEAILHNCVQHGVESQNRDGHPHFLEHLRGRVSWVDFVDRRRASRLRALLEEITGS